MAIKHLVRQWQTQGGEKLDEGMIFLLHWISDVTSRKGEVDNKTFGPN